MKKRQAFTVMEVTIAAILFAVVCCAAYKVFFGVSKTFQRSTKSLVMQNEMRNGLNFLREEMQRASYRSEIRLNGTGIKEVGYEFKLSKETELITSDSGEKKIAVWYICKPFNRTNNTGYVFESSLISKDGNIIYSRVEKEKASSETEEPITNKVLMKGIGKVNLLVEEYESAGEGSMINIEVYGYDKVKNQPELSTSAQTGAKVDIKIKKEL